MNASPNKIINTKWFLIIAGAILLFAFFLYYPITHAGFIANDYDILYNLQTNPISLNAIFLPISSHLTPFFQLILYIEYFFFEQHASYYYVLNILLHLLNIAMTIFLCRKLTKNNAIALLSGFIFAINGTHWRVPMWITTQGQMLATF